MEKNYNQLYRKLKQIDEDFLDYQKRKELEPVQKCLLEIEDFSIWFMKENPLKQDSKVFEKQTEELVGVLRDIVTAIEEHDYVLMHDSITYGMLEYLKPIIAVSTEETT